MTTNLTPEDKDKVISEIQENRSETAWNWFNIFNTGMLLVITLLTFVTNLRVENLKQEIETAKFMESTIDNLATSDKQREIALSVLYSIFIVEKQEQLISQSRFNLFGSHKIPHKALLIDIADTVLRVTYDELLSKSSKDLTSSKSLASSRAIDILCALKDRKCSDWKNKIETPNVTSPDIPQSQEPVVLSPEQVNKNKFANVIFNQSKEGQGKNGLIFIQYNDQSKKSLIDKFRNKLLEKKWNAPGIEFIENYTSPPKKIGEIRYFHENEKELAQELQKILNDEYCPRKECFGEPINLSKNYPNIPRKQFEIWIDAKNKNIK